MNKGMIGLIMWIGLLAAAGLFISAGTTQAAGNASLSDISAGCETFTLMATFTGTVDEEAGFDYLRLHVVDSSGTVVYISAPWRVAFGVTETISFSAGYAYTPLAGPLLFVLEDYMRLELQRLPSLATALAPLDCAGRPNYERPPVTNTCAVRLRIGPGLNYRPRTFLPEGTAMTPVGRLFDSSWLQVRVDESGLLGWVFEGRCLPGSPAEGTYAALPVTHFRTADEMLLYAAGEAP